MTAKKGMLLEAPAALRGKYSLTSSAPSARRASGPTAHLGALGAVRSVARIYAELLGRPITPRQALHLLHAQAAAAVLMLASGGGLAPALLALAWLILAGRQCRQALRARR